MRWDSNFNGVTPDKLGDTSDGRDERQRGQGEAELSAADEQLPRELTERARVAVDLREAALCMDAINARMALTP